MLRKQLLLTRYHKSENTSPREEEHNSNKYDPTKGIISRMYKITTDQERNGQMT